MLALISGTNLMCVKVEEIRKQVKDNKTHIIHFKDPIDIYNTL